MEQRFEFECGGETLVGTLYLPEGAPLAAAITTGPLTSVKEQATGAYAKALAKRGFAALAFDHRYYGASGGRPRQFENPFAKVEDVHAGVRALQRAPETAGLRVTAVGICAGGGYMAHAVATEPAVAAFAGVAGYYAEAAPGETARKVLERGRAAERKWHETGVADVIPAVAEEGGDVGMPLREAYEFYGTPRGAVPTYVNAYAVQSMAYGPRFDAIRSAADITVPTLIVHSENALAPSLARKLLARLDAPHEAVWLDSVGQIDFYDDPRLIDAAADAIERFFRRALAAG